MYIAVHLMSIAIRFPQNQGGLNVSPINVEFVANIREYRGRLYDKTKETWLVLGHLLAIQGSVCFL